MAARAAATYSAIQRIQKTPPQEPAMNRTIAPQVAAFAAAVLLTFGTVAGMNGLATDVYRSASVEQLQSTPMAVAQHVTVVGQRRV
jgi:hypothetical protein